ncbi:MAG TPA: dockerin type I domain-containing protein, partial [Phycisphaerae bacterium]|nr:dockerin type I domain-containing protein [Phycisphaerae bacterium]
YSTPWGTARGSFYGVTGTPTVWFDGVQSVVGAGSIDSAYSQYMAKYTARRAVATDITIQLGGRHISGNNYEVKAKVSMETPGTTKTMRIYMIQVLDHYPTSPTYERYTVIQPAVTYGSEDVITLSAGQFQVITHNFTFSGASAADPNDIKIVAFAEHDPLSSSKEIYQAATMSWPFVPLQILGDMNGDGVVDANDIPLFSLALVNWSAYHALYPDVNMLEAGDMNGDGLFNGEDADPLVPIVINDHTPPSPNPMTWASQPWPVSTSSMTMTATTATDISGVEYYFTANGIGSHPSGWITSTGYTDTGLQTNRSYSYKVKARDMSPQQNTGNDSTTIWEATFIETPGGLTVGTVDSASIQVTAVGPFTRLDQNLSGLYFEVTDMAGTPVGAGTGINAWTQTSLSTTATATGLTPNTTYRFRVRARNYWGHNITPWYPGTDYVYVTTAP